MSRLESFRRRITAQIDGLNWALDKTADLPGDILELGLGNGRTYDHLRSYSDKRIWVVDRILQCHPNCVPPDEDFLQGDADVMMKRLLDQGHSVSLIHSDLGTGDKAFSTALHAELSPLFVELLEPGGVVVSQEPILGLEEVRGPESVAPGRYFFFRKG